MVALRLFHVSISPILLYASEIWGHMEARSHQVLLNKWCKRILGVKDTTPNAAVEGELGQFPMHIFRKLNMLKYWCRMNTDHARHRFHLYTYLRNNIDTVFPGNIKNWAKEVKALLQSIGRPDIWENGIVDIDIGRFMDQAKTTLIGQHIQRWYAEIFAKDKLRLYRQFKQHFGHEPYLNFIKSPGIRVALTRLRLSSHCLEIEMGRYPPRRPVHLRLCQQCDLQETEDELHFILVCPKHEVLRHRYIPKDFYVYPSLAKLTELLSNENIEVSRNIAYYILVALKNRA